MVVLAAMTDRRRPPSSQQTNTMADIQNTFRSIIQEMTAIGAAAVVVEGKTWVFIVDKIY